MGMGMGMEGFCSSLECRSDRRSSRLCGHRGAGLRVVGVEGVGRGRRLRVRKAGLGLGLGAEEVEEVEEMVVEARPPPVHQRPQRHPNNYLSRWPGRRLAAL